MAEEAEASNRNRMKRIVPKENVTEQCGREKNVVAQTDRRTDRRTDYCSGLADRRTDGHASRRTDGLEDWQTNGHTDTQTDTLTHRQTH